MAESSIEWTDCTWNPVVGCSPVSPGCLNCYAATMARRHVGMGTPGYEDRDGVRIAETRGGRAVFTGSVRCLEDRLSEPISWRKPRKVFVCSMSDLFHPAVPFEFIDRVFATMVLCQQHTFQVLTKRPERMAEYFSSTMAGLSQEHRMVLHAVSFCNDVLKRGFADEAHACEAETPLPLPNVWGGTSVENQKAANDRIYHLLRCPLAVRFLSVEPLLGPVALCDWLPWGKHDAAAKIDWVIVGGESGPKARPCDVAWIRSVVRQCADAGVACFVKQLGSRSIWRSSDDQTCAMHLSDRKGADPSEWPEELRVRQWPEVRR